MLKMPYDMKTEMQTNKIQIFFFKKTLQPANNQRLSTSYLITDIITQNIDNLTSSQIIFNIDNLILILKPTWQLQKISITGQTCSNRMCN
jgi:hypothetical protein